MLKYNTLYKKRKKQAILRFFFENLLPTLLNNKRDNK